MRYVSTWQEETLKLKLVTQDNSVVKDWIDTHTDDEVDNFVTNKRWDTIPESYANATLNFKNHYELTSEQKETLHNILKDADINADSWVSSHDELYSVLLLYVGKPGINTYDARDYRIETEIPELLGLPMLTGDDYRFFRERDKFLRVGPILVTDLFTWTVFHYGKYSAVDNAYEKMYLEVNKVGFKPLCKR